MNNIQNQYQPKAVSPPGETLQETLEALNLSPLELAERTNLSLLVLKQILTGQAPLTPEIAVRLESVLGVPAHFWNNRERDYRSFLEPGLSPKPNRSSVLPNRSPSAFVSQMPSTLRHS